MDLHPSDQPRTSSASGSPGETGRGAVIARTSPAAMSPGADASDPQAWLPRTSAAFDSGSFFRRFESQGSDENRRAALSYIPPVALAYFLGRRASPFLRFHAAQGLALELLAVALVAARWLVFGAMDSVQSLAMVFLEIGLTWVFALMCLALVGLWTWGIVAALSGKDTSLPLIGRLSERLLAVGPERTP